MSMDKYIVIADGGDGDITWWTEATHESAIASLGPDEELGGYSYEESYYAILEVDFEAQEIKRVGPYCQ